MVAQLPISGRHHVCHLSKDHCPLSDDNAILLARPPAQLDCQAIDKGYKGSATTDLRSGSSYKARSRDTETPSTRKSFVLGDAPLSLAMQGYKGVAMSEYQT